MNRNQENDHHSNRNQHKAATEDLTSLRKEVAEYQQIYRQSMEGNLDTLNMTELNQLEEKLEMGRKRVRYLAEAKQKERSENILVQANSLYFKITQNKDIGLAEALKSVEDIIRNIEASLTEDSKDSDAPLHLRT
eukprot:TRINITY_DN1532_c0_g1_i1.p1 TRINITY_DN1532_c0_g1~~TRINITY_DN1532_c0_g1_i1.p1  ORF type:complete len:135 (-),score=28.01 TRINITY_DN1532_c0_g1_i1:104-508(-)